MAFNIQNLASAGNNARPITDRTAGALGRGAPQMWTYVTEDAHTTVDGAGYFNGGTAYGGAYNQLNIGDLIYVVVLSSAAVSTAGFHVVVDKASGTLDVTNVNAITLTDSD